jgi:hypothetical protein
VLFLQAHVKDRGEAIFNFWQRSSRRAAALNFDKRYIASVFMHHNGAAFFYLFLVFGHLFVSCFSGAGGSVDEGKRQRSVISTLLFSFSFSYRLFSSICFLRTRYKTCVFFVTSRGGSGLGCGDRGQRWGNWAGCHERGLFFFLLDFVSFPVYGFTKSFKKKNHS